jgi:NADH-quinone oxidoreductase subunit G
MVKIQINGKFYDVDPGKNLLHTCLGLGFDIPYFCYHPALGSVGACRLCAVKKFKNEGDKKGKIVMSCMEPVAEGLIISTDDPEVRAFRASIIESLMTNHPHDCPVCDEGGECHLQDMTVMTGHNYRRFVFKKRTHNNQYLGPYIHHEMNRCIQCYRCVRFYRDYAGGKDLNVFGSAANVYFGRHKEGKLESEFSGNLIEVCPTGVFTDKTLQEHYTRKWDLTNSPSICTACSLGCNIIVSERYGMVRRIMNRYNSAVNGYFICDNGRFSYEKLNSPDRIRKIMIKDSVTGKKFPDANSLSLLQPAVKNITLTGIGSPAASLESNFVLETLVGKENFYHGIPDTEYEMVKESVRIMNSGIAHSASLKDVESSDAILILGEDLNNAQRLALSVRQASRNKSFGLAAKAGISLWNDAAVRDLAQNIKTPVFIVSNGFSAVDDIAELRYNASSKEITDFVFDIASAIGNSGTSQEKSGDSIANAPKKIAAALMSADNPLIITGFKSGEKRTLQAAENIALALSSAGKKPSHLIIFPACNSLGLGLMDGKPFGDLLGKSKDKNGSTLVILENDLYSRFEKEQIDGLLDKYENIIVLGSQMDETTKKAGFVLPAGAFTESTGTIVNNEGRAQRYYRVLPEEGQLNDSWKIISDLIRLKDNVNNSGLNSFEDVSNAFYKAYPFFSKIRNIMPDSNFRYFSEKIARQTSRFSGRTAMNADKAVSEPKPPEDRDSPLDFSMEGFKGIPPSSLVPYYWSPGWNSPQATNKYLDEPGGEPEDGNPGVLLFNNLGF